MVTRNGNGTPVDTDLERMEAEHQETLRARHKRDVDKIRDDVVDKVATRLVQDAISVKPCRVCGNLSAGCRFSDGSLLRSLCPTCKQKHDAAAEAIIDQYIEATSGVEATMAVEAPRKPVTWTGNEIGKVLPKPRRMGDHLEMQYDAGGINLPIAVEYEWEDVYSKDGDRVVGSKRTPIRVQMFPESDTTKFICDQIDLDDDQILDRFEREDRKYPRHD